jgi:hypothetical protein
VCSRLNVIVNKWARACRRRGVFFAALMRRCAWSSGTRLCELAGLPVVTAKARDATIAELLEGKAPPPPPKCYSGRPRQQPSG